MKVGSGANDLGDDRKLIQGTWAIVSILADVVTAHAESYVEITGVKSDVVSSDQVKESSYSLDFDKSPKWLDLTTAVSKKRSAGNYELSGDELKISINDGGKETLRADGFEWKPKFLNAELMVLNRWSYVIHRRIES